MGKISDDIASYFGNGNLTVDDILSHRGVDHTQSTPGSGRYVFGSGDDAKPEEKQARDFLQRIDFLKKGGWKETAPNIMEKFGMTSTQYRTEKALAIDARRSWMAAKCQQLKESKHGPTEIGRRLGIRDTSVISLLNETSLARTNQAKKAADFLKNVVDKKGIIDVGLGAEKDILETGISKEKLRSALYILEKDGYKTQSVRARYPNDPNKAVTYNLLVKPGTNIKDLYDYSKIANIKDYETKDHGETYQKKYEYPSSLDSKRIRIRYAEDGGEQKDGIIEIRRGLNDINLNGSRYSQVRILVDGTHYIKGMAVYSDGKDMPDGVDIIFNTNKTKDIPMKGDKNKSVLKPIKNDPDNPFGSSIKPADQGGQFYYVDKKTGKRMLSPINKHNDEGDWSDWKDALPSQFLSKQPKQLAKRQLDLAIHYKNEELKDIMMINNPTIRKHYLSKFVENCDKAAVDLKAAALPGQKYHVIIPLNTLPDTQVYAPKYKNGTKLALIRYPHAGQFEIPILTVNNKNDTAIKLLGRNPDDAIAINYKIAKRLSGADFDGDTVMCIPTGYRDINIKNRNPLKGLEGFEPSDYKWTEIKTNKKGETEYYRNGRKFSVMKNTDNQMGVISNLITDMTLGGASDSELARAVRHSMVVIDAEKHKLDYKYSEAYNNIAELKKKYQPKFDSNGKQLDQGGSAFTIISRAKGEESVLKRRGNPLINIKGSKHYDPSKPEGSLLYKTALDRDLYYAESKFNKATNQYEYKTKNKGVIKFDKDDKESARYYYPRMEKDKKTGEIKFFNSDKTIEYKVAARTSKSTRMAETDDAYSLVSKHRNAMEILYADYANSMKKLANDNRIRLANTPNLAYDKNASKIYSEEVNSLNNKLNAAERNKIPERTAIRLAAQELKEFKVGRDLSNKDTKKKGTQLLNKQREQLGGLTRKERNFTITDREWEAIQAGAISDSKLRRILNNVDVDSLRDRAMPKQRISLNSTQVARARAMYNSNNYTLAEIAEKFGTSPNTIKKYIKGGH